MHLDRGVSEVTVIPQLTQLSLGSDYNKLLHAPRAFTRPKDFLSYTPTCLLQADVVIGKLHNVRDDALIVFNENLVRLPNPHPRMWWFSADLIISCSFTTLMYTVYIICITFGM